MLAWSIQVPHSLTVWVEQPPSEAPSHHLIPTDPSSFLGIDSIRSWLLPILPLGYPFFTSSPAISRFFFFGGSPGSGVGELELLKGLVAQDTGAEEVVMPVAWFSLCRAACSRGALLWEHRGRGKGPSQSLHLCQGGAGLAAMWNTFGPEDDD